MYREINLYHGNEQFKWRKINPNQGESTMSRKLVFILVVIVLTVFLAAGVSYAVSPEQQAKIFAEENLPSWLSCLADDYEHLHYDNPGQVKQSYVGEPLKGYTISENIDLSKSIDEQKKLASFYDVPVLYDGKIVTDLHVYCNKENTWEVIGIGGSLSKTIDLVCKANGLSSEDISVLRSAGQIFVTTKKGNVEVGFAPFFSDPQVGLKSKTVVPVEIIKNAIAHQNKILLSNKYDKTIGGSSSSSLGFNQESIWFRLYRYVDHYI